MKTQSKLSPVVILIFILMMTLSLQGCVKKNTNDTASGSLTSPVIRDYFPIHKNVHYIYEGVGNEFAAYDLWVDYTSTDKLQQRISNGGTVVSRVYQVSEEALTKTFSREEAYYHENFLDTTSGDPEVMLMMPLKTGTRWTLSDGRIRSIVSTDAKITVPLGNYTALQVITEDPQNPSNTTYDYYVKNVGLVKTVFLMGNSEISSSLKEIIKDIPQNLTLQFYYPNVDTGTYTPVAKDLKFYTNDKISNLIEKAYKQVPTGNLGTVLTPNTKINRLTLSPEGIVLVDLSKEFRTQMNAGSDYEGMILQSIANTFGTYYNHAEEVILTIDNQPYSSGHYEFEEGESISASYEN